MRYDIICAGMALVDSIIRGFRPEPVSSAGYLAESGSLSVGGEAVNASIASAKLGMRTGILCTLGDDPAGEMVRNELTRNGVDTSLIRSGPATPVTTIFVREDGTRRSVTNHSHRYNFHPEQDPALFTEAKALIIGSLFRAPFDDPAVIHAVLSSAKAAGQLIIADTKLPNFRALAPEDIRDSLPMIDTITPNEDEARFFTGKEEPEAMADIFLAFGIRNVIIKLGSKGCLMKNRDTTLRLPAIPIHPVDATGAGDHFAAGYTAEILRGASAEKALIFANACGAICTTAVGAGSALKDRNQVLRLLAENGYATA